MSTHTASDPSVFEKHSESYYGWHIELFTCQVTPVHSIAGGKLSCLGHATFSLFDPQAYENGWICVDHHAIPGEGERLFRDQHYAHTALVFEAMVTIDSLMKKSANVWQPDQSMNSSLGRTNEADERGRES